MIGTIIPEKLLESKELLFDKCDFILSNFIEEKESSDYDAFRFELNNKKIIFRNAKITPTKIGQFVTFWKRNEKGTIEPFESSDIFDLFVINVKTKNNFGQFVFPKRILIEKGIVTKNSKEGKRAIRVYPSWDITINKQAKKTQEWQLQYFVPILKKGNLNIEKIKMLFLENK